jgi:hypothetical protein
MVHVSQLGVLYKISLGFLDRILERRCLCSPKQHWLATRGITSASALIPLSFFKTECYINISTESQLELINPSNYKLNHTDQFIKI